MRINWYPGHMKKSIDKIKESLKLVDIVAEIVDARIPFSSRNPLIDKVINNKARLIILNKVDMANPVETKKWVQYFNDQGIKVVEYNSTKDRSTKKIYSEAKDILKDLFDRRYEKNIDNKTIKMMVVGIPNVGKSTFINNLSNRKGAKVGNRPGVTRSNQWIKTDSDLLLLDTPGVLWPKLDLYDNARNLAFTGSIKDEVLEIEDLTFEFIKKLKDLDPAALENRYKVDASQETLEIMDQIAIKTGSMLRGQEIDYFKVSNIILDDFRKLRLGRITLESADDIEMMIEKSIKK
ncbi:ribosome biogenesis GTPase YlqF [uncultured Helcococcus sp.]|uniref:ribosome biogenesis GTPase YlqF n=1 Tax=uncultured Helcococcus sp. TaxID=1072508 RepID=UPI002633D822|nr:ribosome biogenesis GTPase YlqF [uncultured Helcococcus sp.]